MNGGGGAFYTTSSTHMTIPHVAPVTSSATLNSILTTTASPRAEFHSIHHQQRQQEQQHRLPETPLTVPAKRKIRDISQSPVSNNYQLENLLQTPSSGRRSHNGRPTTPVVANDVSTEAIDCICGFAIDDGFSIACDLCSRWCHSACFGINSSGPVPDSFVCWRCHPRPHHVKEAAIALQRARLDTGPLGNSGLELGLGLGQRQRLSPGLERKGRRGSTTAADPVAPARKRRRGSVVHPVPPTPTPPTSTLTTITNGPTSAAAAINGEDEHVDIDTEPWTSTYVPITADIIPDDETRSKLRRHARAWRGVTAVSSPTISTEPVFHPKPTSTPPISIRPLPPTPSLLLPTTNPLCLPPSYAAYTTRPLPSSSMVVPFHSMITPTSSYLREPTNGYASLGMPKPHVHLLGPPLGVALDARGVGSEGRFVRWGCRPNAVLRPVICRRGEFAKGGIRTEKEVDEDATEDEEPQPDHDRQKGHASNEDDDTTLGFAVFALRDLKEGEEVVLGWEWDDGHAIHQLPALLKVPGMFPTPPSNRSPAELMHLRNQLSNVVHALSSTFTTCACGSSANDCALIAMSNLVDQLEAAGVDLKDWTPDSFDRRSERYATDDEGRQERGARPYRGYQQPSWRDVDFGPLIGRKRGFRTRERVPHSGGIGGMELVDDEEPRPGSNDEGKESRNRKRVVIPTAPETPKATQSFQFSVESPDNGGDKHRKGKERAVDGDVDMEEVDGTRAGRAMPVDDRQSKPSLLHPETIHNSTISSSRTHPNLEPRPPDPPDAHSSHIPASEDRMPPKMRKQWMHREVKTRNNLTDANISPIDPHISSTDPVPKSLVSSFRKGDVGLGIRLDIPDAIPCEPPHTQTITSSTAHVTPSDQRRHPHSSDPHENSLMPPPPIPSATDRATISPEHTSTSSPTPSPPSPSPRLTTPSPPTHKFSGGPPSPQIHSDHDSEHDGGHSHISAFVRDKKLDRVQAASPLHDFASLSLMSPAMIIAESKAAGKQRFDARRDVAPDVEEACNKDHDVEMVFEQGHVAPQEANAEQSRTEDEPAAHMEEVWQPLRRVDMVAAEVEGPAETTPAEIEAHAASMHSARSPSPSPAPERYRETVPEPAPERPTTTISPLDSLASTPAARLSPAPAPVAPQGVDVQDEDDAPRDNEEDMEVDGGTERPDTPSQSPRALLPKLAAPPPSHFFDTDDEDEWKRQMAADDPHIVPPAAPVTASLPHDFNAPREQEAPMSPARSETYARGGSVESTRSTLSADITVTVEMEEPPPPTGTTVDSEPPPSTASTEDGEQGHVDTLDPPAPAVATSAPTLQPPLADMVVDSPEPPAASSSATETNSTASPDLLTVPNARQDSQEPTSPATQPKVKLSLRDFALRKKKLREEMEATKSSQASPMSVHSVLAPDEGDGEGAATPRSAVASPQVSAAAPRWLREPAAPVIPSVPETTEPVPVPEPTKESLTIRSADALPKGRDIPEALKRDAENEQIRKAQMLAETKKRDLENIKAFQESTKHAAGRNEWVTGLAKTYEELTSNVQVLEAALAPPAPVVPPPATTKIPDPGTSLNGTQRSQPVNSHPVHSNEHAPPPSFTSSSKEPPPRDPPREVPSAAKSNPLPLPPLPSAPVTWAAKKELIDTPTNLSAPTSLPQPTSLPPLRYHANPNLPPTPAPSLVPRGRSRFADRSISPISPDVGRAINRFHARRPSHEDGEIGEPSSAAFAPTHASGSNAAPIPKTRAFLAPFTPAPPPSHSPPRGPRSLFAPRGSPTPPAPPTFGPPSRPPPSAPRALRASMMSGGRGPPATGANAAPAGSSYGGGSHYVPRDIPRGPSADLRERDYEPRHYRGRRGGGRARQG